MPGLVKVGRQQVARYLRVGELEVIQELVRVGG